MHFFLDAAAEMAGQGGVEPKEQGCRDTLLPLPTAEHAVKSRTQDAIQEMMVGW